MPKWPTPLCTEIAELTELLVQMTIYIPICLTQGEASCYTYDENGNVTEVVANSRNTTTMSYTGNNLTAVTDEDGTSTYTYDSKNNITGATSVGGLNTSYTYNTNGTVSAVQASDGSKTMNTSYTYSNSGNYVTEVVDSIGGTHTSSYNESTGLLTSSQAPCSAAVNYTYQSNNNLLTQISSYGRSVQYGYNSNKLLSTITHNGFNYNLSYDYGYLSGVSIGSRTLSTKDYSFLTGELYHSSYGNGNDVSTNYAHIANINPIRYRGYYYDIETGFYYLQSRYYDPEVGRFINADSYISTGQSILGNNMFAYCNNNPVNLIDYNGQGPLKVARYLLTHWILGNGKDLILNSNSFVSKSLKKSKTMHTKIDEEIAKYEKGEEYGKNSVIFQQDEPDLWLGIRRAKYEMTIEKESKITGFWLFKKTQTRYVVNVKVSDTYNFNLGNETGDGLGSYLNNLGYWAQENNIGKEYYWEANFVYKTKWT